MALAVPNLSESVLQGHANSVMRHIKALVEQSSKSASGQFEDDLDNEDDLLGVALSLGQKIKELAAYASLEKIQ